MLTKIKFSRTNTLKILLFLPFLLLASNAIAMKKTNSTNLQKLIKTILIEELCINSKLAEKIDASKLPCEGFFERFTTKTNKTIIYTISPKSYFTIIAGANSYQEVQEELANNPENNPEKKFLTIKKSGDYFVVETEEIFETFEHKKCSKLKRRPC